jgi:hypothetical protein
LWQKCLEAVPGSRLLIQLSSYQGEFVEKKFRERLEKSGLDTSRVDIGRNYGQDGYYGTYNLVDVMLDSMPFGGGTTTSEAIWMGVPVIGCKYPMRHARMAYTFMSHVGLGHLCADSVETYPEKVREVSRNVDLLRDLRRNLRKKLRGMPLYDTGVFRRAFENAMRDAYADWCIEHKKPIDIDAYRKNDSRLLLDCIRAADIVVREIARERGRKEERLSAFITEYFEIHQVLMERLLVIFQNEAGMLVIAEKAAQLLELTESAPDAATAVSMISAIKSIITKFA